MLPIPAAAASRSVPAGVAEAEPGWGALVPDEAAGADAAERAAEGAGTVGDFAADGDATGAAIGGLDAAGGAWVPAGAAATVELGLLVGAAAAGALSSERM